MLCQAAKVAGFSFQGWLHELAPSRSQLHSGWHSGVSVGATVPLCCPGVSGAFRRTDSSADVPSCSSLWLPRWRGAVWGTPRSQKPIWQVNWELSQESYGELDVGWLQLSLGSCCQFHTSSSWWLVMYRTFCVRLNHLKHVFSFIPLLPLFSLECIWMSFQFMAL